MVSSVVKGRLLHSNTGEAMINSATGRGKEQETAQQQRTGSRWASLFLAERSSESPPSQRSTGEHACSPGICSF